MKYRVCIDASLVTAILVIEEHSQPAFYLWKKWITEDYDLVAPCLLRYEVTSVIYRKALRGLISREDASLALQHFLKMNLEWIDPPSLPERATEIAYHFSRPNTYDAHYLALAEHLNCEFWTCDERLYNAVKDGLGFVHLVGY